MGSMFRLWEQMARIGLESQMVIGLRVAAMMGLVPQARGENSRMVVEKQAAAGEAMRLAMRAAFGGASPDRVMAAALRPYGRRTKANARRLTRDLTR